MRIKPTGTGWLQDLRHVLRGLVRAPSFTIVAVLTLAIGMGGTVIMFTLVHAAYLRPLPYPEANRLVRVFTGYQNDLSGRNAISPLTWQDALERPDLLRDAEVWNAQSYHLSDDAGTVRRVAGARVSAGFLPLMGATPTVGRLFDQDDVVPGDDRSVILSHGMWIQSFGADPGVVGNTLVLDDVAYRIVGVMAPDFDSPRGVDLWVPLALGPEWYTPQRRGWEFLSAVARLGNGVTPAAVANGLTEQLAREAPDRVADVGQRVNVVPLRDDLVGDAGTVVLVLLAAVGLVLLIGSANVMNLVLARAEIRRREFTLRRALGAGAGRLARLVFLETLALSVIGGTLGIVAAAVVTHIIAAAPPESVADLGPLTIGWPIVAFAAVLSAGIGLLFGMVPVVGTLSSHPGDVLRSSTGRAAGTVRSSRMRSGLVIAEVSFAVVLVFGVGITAESFRRLTAVAPGFEPGAAVAINLETPAQGYDAVRRSEAYRRVLDRVRGLPGVSQAALTYALPLTGVQWSASFELAEPNPALPEAALGGNMRPVSPGYFRLMGIPLIEGRPLRDEDAPGSPPVVVIDETLAKRVWPGRSPIGERIDLGVFVGGDREATVVGVVGNVLDRGLSTPPSAHVYFSAWQSPQRSMILVAQPARAGIPLASSIRNAVAEVEPRIPVYDVRPVSSVIADSLASQRMSFLLMGSFAGAALLLVAVGVYGVLSYTMALRTKEIGTRMALGATPRSVLGLVLRQVAGLWLIGGIIGAIVAFVSRSAAGGLLFEVDTGNPVFIAVAIAGLGLVALVAGVIPAHRAAHMDCVVALRQE